MEPVEKIIDHAPNLLTIELPEEYRNKKVKVTVTSLEDELPKKYDFSDVFGKLKWEVDAVAEQRKLRDEWN